MYKEFSNLHNQVVRLDSAGRHHYESPLDSQAKGQIQQKVMFQQILGDTCQNNHDCLSKKIMKQSRTKNNAFQCNRTCESCVCDVSHGSQHKFIVCLVEIFGIDLVPLLFASKMLFQSKLLNFQLTGFFFSLFPQQPFFSSDAIVLLDNIQNFLELNYDS